MRKPFLTKDRGGGRLHEYEHGEDARAIDWRASARKGSLQSRDIAGNCTLAWGVVTDESPSMKAGRDRALSEAAKEAAEFWRSCGSAGDRWIDVEAAEGSDLFRRLDRALRVLPAHSALLVIGDFFDLPAVPGALLRRVAQRLDCTALVARDPWRDDFPLAGFVTVADLETTDVRRFFIGPRERKRFQNDAAARERAILTRLRRSNWRAATFCEDNGARAVLRAFGAA